MRTGVVATLGFIGSALVGAGIQGTVSTPSSQMTRWVDVQEVSIVVPGPAEWPEDWKSGTCTPTKGIYDGHPGVVCDACTVDGQCTRHARPQTLLGSIQPFVQASCTRLPGYIDGVQGGVLQCSVTRTIAINDTARLPKGTVVVY